MGNAVHDGHRMRLKERYLNEGLDSFQSHEILELLLFFCIPRQDTNELAHILINQFGSLSEVMDAPYEELFRVKGMTKSNALLLNLIPKACGCYLRDKHTGQQPFHTVDIIGDYCVTQFLGVTVERVYLLCLDSSLNLICCEKVSDGTVTRANVPIRTVASSLIRHNAARVVLAHNHPRGIAKPSSEDVVLTRNLVNALVLLEAELVDHIVVAGKDFCSIHCLYPEIFIPST